MTAGEVSTSPSPRPGLRAFLPLSEEAALSTRGQNLPALIQSLSTPPRRNSSWRFLPDLVRAQNEAHKRPGDRERRFSTDSHSFDERNERRPTLEDRRMSSAIVALMTPEMRSQRLIGNANPRYKWFVEIFINMATKELTLDQGAVF